MTDGLRIELTDAPAEGDIAFVEERLIGFNEARALPYDRRPLCVFVRDDAGTLIGGVTGDTNWGWLYLDCFWLPDTLRQDGLGSRILAVAEAEAMARGCTRARLFSYSFQAPGFYERHGYEVFGTLDDYPPGHAQIWLRKRLAGD